MKVESFQALLAQVPSLTPKGSARDLVPVLIGRVRGTHQVSDSVLTAMTAGQAEDALRKVVGPDTLLCTDGSGALRTAAAKLGSRPSQLPWATTAGSSEGVYHVRRSTTTTSGSRPGSTVSCVACPPSTCPATSHGCSTGEWFKDGIKPEHFVVSGLGKQLINT